MEQVEEICDHIILVNQGKKILDGTVSGVKQTFKENIFSIQVSDIPTAFNSASFEVLKQQGNKLTVKINEGSRSNDVLQYFLQQNITIEGFNEILPSLNDIFIHLVEGTKATRQFQPVA
jgi:ABC-2 type transport system ATP-binding protein